MRRIVIDLRQNIGYRFKGKLRIRFFEKIKKEWF